MAKRYIDAAKSDTRETMSEADGTSLTLTNSVRVLWDNTLPKNDLIVLIDRIRDRIIETSGN